MFLGVILDLKLPVANLLGGHFQTKKIHCRFSCILKICASRFDWRDRYELWQKGEAPQQIWDELRWNPNWLRPHRRWVWPQYHKHDMLLAYYCYYMVSKKAYLHTFLDMLSHFCQVHIFGNVFIQGWVCAWSKLLTKHYSECGCHPAFKHGD